MNRRRTKKALWRKERKFRNEQADEIVRKLKGTPKYFDLEEDYFFGYKGTTDMDVGSYYAPYIIPLNLLKNDK